MFVADLFFPVRGLAVQDLLNGNVGHGSVWRGSVPMFYAGRYPYDIPLSDLLNRATPLLYPAGARCHDQSLAERMVVPRCSGTRLEW